jgi:hypothetical protein
MESKSFALIEMLVFACIALGIGIWQYVSVSRELKKTRQEAESAQSADDEQPKA